jgi:hypothetical protein
MEWKNVLREGFVLPAIDHRSPLADVVSAVLATVADHLSCSPAIREYLAQLPKGAGTHCPDSSLDELVRFVTTQLGTIDKSDPKVTCAFMEEIIAPVFEFERNELSSVLYLLTLKKHLSLDELLLFENCMLLARATDIFWLKWFEAVALPYQSLSQEEKDHYADLTGGTLAHYDYTVFDLKPGVGCADRRTWAQAFPDEISVIAGVLSITEIHTLEPSLKKYFAALRDAYTCTDVSKLELLWTEVDIAWIKIPASCQIIPVHGMEAGYQHPFGVSPEFRLEIRTQESRKLIEERRLGTSVYAAAMGLDEDLVTILSQKLERIDISVFVGALRSGVCMNSRSSGQAVPNRQVVLAEGGRIFLDRGAPARSAERYNYNLEKHCALAASPVFRGGITPEDILIHTINHEYAHPVGRTKESDAGIGGDGMKLLEEGKATLLGILADEWRESTDENRLRLTRTTVGRVLRFMYKNDMENHAFAAYIRENLVAANMLFESGIMSLSEEGVMIDSEKAKSRVWFDALKEFNLAVIAAYQAKDKATLLRLTRKYCDVACEPVAGLIKWVNRV